MALDRQVDDHEFNPVTKKCDKCGITREAYEERGKRPCTGQRAIKPDFVPDDPLEIDH
jgi:hypothetical protein